MSVTLLTAHRILIAAATLFFAFYGGWEIAHRAGAAGGGSTARGILAFLAAVAFGMYLLSLRGRRSSPDQDGEGGRP